MKLLKAELMKLKRRRTFWFALALIGVELLWLLVTAEKYLYRDYANRIVDFSYSIIWDIVIYNSLFFPLMIAILASRIADTEHKGCTLKLLLTTQSPAKLFWVKYLVCAMVLLAATALQALFIAVYPALRGCTLTIPPLLLLEQTLSTLLVSCFILSFQLSLSLLVTNQIPALVLGISGSFLGMMSQLFPPLIARLIPWYYFSGTSVISSYYAGNSMNFALHSAPAATCAVILTLTLLIAAFGTFRFQRKEV